MPALTDFKAAIDGLRLNANVTRQIHDLGEALYMGAVREDADHIDLHMDSLVADNPGDVELAARVTVLKTATQRVRAGADTRVTLDEERR